MHIENHEPLFLDELMNSESKRVNFTYQTLTYSDGENSARKWDTRFDFYMELGDYDEHISGIWLNFGIIIGLIIVIVVMMKAAIAVDF